MGKTRLFFAAKTCYNGEQNAGKGSFIVMPPIISITDLTQPELDIFCRLTEAQLRTRLEPAKGIFIAESPTIIGLALNAGCHPLALLTERKFIEGNAAAVIAHCGEIPIYTGEREALAALTGYELTRGVLCAMRRPAPMDCAALCAAARRVAVLENVVDSTNVGAIIRSAAALGIDAVLLTPTCCDPLNRRAVRVSMGTVFQIPWAYLESADDYLPQLKAMGFRTAAMALRDDSVSIEDKDLAAEQKLAIILGTEGTGLTAHTIENCDYTVKIPMQHGVDSLNVAAASAVAFWELRAK